MLYSFIIKFFIEFYVFVVWLGSIIPFIAKKGALLCS